jgi:UDP-N-acetylglucosamine diphosphorylase/glucosamine-1-phosphate N-acetyltransferase
VDLFETLEPGEIAVERLSGDLIAANLTPDRALALLSGERPDGAIIEVADHLLIRRPWGWIDFRDRAMQVDLTLAQAAPSADAPIGVIEFGEYPVTIHPTARVYPSVVLDAEHGPIHIENHATVRPGAVICGPAIVGPSATVAEHAVIRANTAIGPHCKVGGEVSGTVFQGYSNKAHDGFLGDSWIGEWVNLGAGTTNSNLLNTYGEIKALAEPMDDREPTGRTFLGCVVGDHSKLAIGTRIMTGAIVHTANLYVADPPIAGCAPGFCYVVGDDLQPYQFDKLVQTLVAVMGRRSVRPTEAYLQRLATLHGNAMALLDALDDGSEDGPEIDDTAGNDHDELTDDS